MRIVQFLIFIIMISSRLTAFGQCISEINLSFKVLDPWPDQGINLKNHPSYKIQLLPKSDARFVFIRYNGFLIQKLMKGRKRRSNNNPYVCWMHYLTCDKKYQKTGKTGYEALFNRSDILFVNYDLGDHLLTQKEPCQIRGVTVAPPYYYKGRPRTKGQKDKYLLSFRGKCSNVGWFNSSQARSNLKKLLNGTTRHSRGLILFEDTNDPGIHTSLEEYNELLKLSTFSLIPRGDGRWSYRFSECIGAGSIPVIISDNLTLPYSQLIDWSKASIRIKEDDIPHLTIDELVQRLPSSQIAEEMKIEIEKINSKYFCTPSKRFNALLQSLHLEAIRYQ